MNKVSLTLEDDYMSADDMENTLEALKPILRQIANWQIHIKVIEDNS